jgi:hypothetical protein
MCSSSLYFTSCPSSLLLRPSLSASTLFPISPPHLSHLPYFPLLPNPVFFSSSLCLTLFVPSPHSILSSLLPHRTTLTNRHYTITRPHTAHSERHLAPVRALRSRTPHTGPDPPQAAGESSASGPHVPED